jgi:hypothetical protein
MPKGSPLTPAQLGRLAEVFARTGSFAAAGEAIGVEKSVARRALLRMGTSPGTTLRATAVTSTLENVRLGVARITREILRRTRKKAIGSLSLEDLHVASKSLGTGGSRVESIAELLLKRRQATLTRKKTRAEIDALKKGTALSTEQLLAYLAALPRDELLTLIATLRAQREASPAPKPPAPDGAT